MLELEKEFAQTGSSINEIKLFETYNLNPSVEARNNIVQKYLYLAEILSRKFINRGVDYEDIYQVACLALIKAVERFSPDRGVKFITFATPTIVGEIKRYFRDKSSSIRVPRRIYEVYQKVNNAKLDLTQKLQRVPKVKEISEYLNISEETVLEVLESYNAQTIQSFEQNIGEDDDLELGDTIGQQDINFEIIENRDFINKVTDKLSEIEKKFVTMRYIQGHTQKEISNNFGVSQMYVSRLEKKVLDKFRNILYK